MDCSNRIEVPLRSGGGKKMKKRKELDALIANSLSKRGARSTINSQDKLLSVSTDDPDDYTWMNVSRTSRRNQRKIYLRKCVPFFCGITAVFFVATLYWLYFDLRQQIADYRQKIEEVSAISKIFPDTLQHWHETTSFLRKNQSIIFCQLNDLTQNVGNFSSNLSSLAAAVNAQRSYGQDDKLVADFGAKLEAVSSDMEGIKDHYNRYTEVQKSLELETQLMKANISQLSMSQAVLSPTNFTKNVNYLNETMRNSLRHLNINLMDINSTLSQTIKIMNGEILSHKTKLDDLLDRSENITSHVATLGNNWQEFKQQIANVDEQLNKIKEKISLIENKSRGLSDSVEELKVLCKDRVDGLTNQLNLEDKSITDARTNISLQQTSTNSITGNLS